MSEAKTAHEADDGQIDLEFSEDAQEVEIEAPEQQTDSASAQVNEEAEDEH